MSARRALAGVVVGAAVFLVTAEAASRVALSSDAFLRRADVGTSSSRRVTTIARVTALDRMPFFDSDSVRFDPELGHTSRPMDADMEDDGVMHHYRVDDQYRRATAPKSWSAEPGAPTIAVLGDSFAFGDEVGDRDTFAWKLREETGATVHNHGTLGFGLDQVWLQWARDVAPDKPDAVILLLTDAVALRTGMPWDNWAKPWAAVGADGLTVEGQPVPPPDAFLPTWWTPRTPQILSLWRARRAHQDEVHQALAIAPRVLDALASDVAASGAALVVVYGPIPDDYEGPDARASGTHDQVFVPWCERADNAVCIDLYDLFVETLAANVRLTRVNHWTPAGHDLVADAVSLALQEEGLLGGPGDTGVP